VRKYCPKLYQYPILQFVDETSKILLMNEIELVYWYFLMKKYLTIVKNEAKYSHDSVRLFFFETAMFVKKFLLHR